MKSCLPFLLSLTLGGLLPAGATLGDEPLRGGPDCPATRNHIEPRLHTVPEDGRYYVMTRGAIAMPVDRLIEAMGGVDRAYAVARATRAEARARLARGITGGEGRYLRDTVLRAEALVEILDCLTGRTSA